MDAKSGQTSKSNLLTELSPREQEIFNMLLEGTTLKEIAYSMNVKYSTIAFHQKNIFQKLGVENLNKLLVKYLREKSSPNSNDINEGIPAVFTRWGTFRDNHGSTAGITVKEEKIKEDNFICCILFGTLSTAHHTANAGVMAYPDPSTIEAMKTMSSFSFTVMGDGKTYEVLLATSDTILKGGLNHFGKKFTTTKNMISTFSFNVSDLAQNPYWGETVPLNLDNLDHFIIQAHSNGDFNLKIWNIRTYQNL